MVATPASFAGAVEAGPADASSGTTDTVAPGRIAPVASTTVTIRRASRAGCAEATEDQMRASVTRANRTNGIMRTYVLSRTCIYSTVASRIMTNAAAELLKWRPACRAVAREGEGGRGLCIGRALKGGHKWNVIVFLPDWLPGLL